MYMTVPISYDLHAFTFMILLLFSLIIINKNDKYDFRRRVMLALFCINMALLAIEALTYFINGDTATSFNIFVNRASNFMLLLLIPVFASVWAVYIDYIVFESIPRLKSRYMYYVPTVLIFLMLIVNIFVPFLFSVDSNNLFHKGPFHWTLLIIISSIYVNILLIVIQNRLRIKSSAVWAILSFGIYPVIFEVLEFIVGEMPYTFVSIAFGLCSNYLIIETFSSNRDNLTGLYTRSKATNSILQSIKRHTPFSVVLIDLDDFKYINDTFGHLTGDRAIIEFSKTMITAIGKQCTISRIGGDEFLIVGDACSIDAIHEKMKELKVQLKLGGQPYSNHLDFSYGIVNYDGKAVSDEESLIQLADQRMYADKDSKKAK